MVRWKNDRKLLEQNSKTIVRKQKLIFANGCDILFNALLYLILLAFSFMELTREVHGAAYLAFD